MNRHRLWLTLALLGPAAALPGCNKSADPNLAPVSGTVTLGGEPLANATVTFIPKDGTPGFGGVGKTDAAGKYALKGSRDDAPGIPPGGYRVVIGKRLMPDGSEVPASDNTPPMASPARESLPDMYSSMTMTTLTATVPVGGGTFDFPLLGKKK
jgi:hypothetical protein